MLKKERNNESVVKRTASTQILRCSNKPEHLRFDPIKVQTQCLNKYLQLKLYVHCVIALKIRPVLNFSYKLFFFPGV